MAKSSFHPLMPIERLLLKALLLYVDNAPCYMASERNTTTLRNLITHSTPSAMDTLFAQAARDRRLHHSCIAYDQFREKTSDKLFANILTGMAVSLSDPTLTMGELYCIAESEDTSHENQ